MNAELKYWFLRDHKLFRNLSFSEIDSLCILKRFKKSKKDEVVELPYSEKEKVYLLKLGTLKLMKIDEQGNEVLVEIIQKGDLFGELSFDKEDERQEFMKVVSDEAIICTFFRDKLEEVMLRKPDFAINYIKFIGFNYKKIQNSYRNIFFKDARTRLLLLLQMLVEKEEIQANSFTIPSYLTQKDIAQLICTTRQTIIRLFQELETEGILSYTQNQLIIPDIRRLQNLLKNVK
jgi:CRP-like cAMP-binding protein